MAALAAAHPCIHVIISSEPYECQGFPADRVQNIPQRRGITTVVMTKARKSRRRAGRQESDHERGRANHLPISARVASPTNRSGSASAPSDAPRLAAMAEADSASARPAGNDSITPATARQGTPTPLARPRTCATDLPKIGRAHV